MFGYIWPITLVILSNIVYQVCTKSVPSDMSPLASLTVTYFVGAVTSAVLYFVTGKGGNLFSEIAKTNWAPLVLGLMIVGLETGYIYAYKAGWPISTAFIVQGSVLAVALIFVGWLFYHETLTVSKLIGIAFCLVGLIFINYKQA